MCPLKPNFLTGGGGGGTQQSFIQGGSALRSNPLPFYIPFFDRKGTPFVYLPLKNGTPFTYLLKNTDPFSKPLEGSLLVVFMQCLIKLK